MPPAFDARQHCRLQPRDARSDVGDRGAWKNLKEQVGDVDFLMLNAGVGGKGSWGDEEYFDKVSLMVRGRRLGVLKCTDLTHKLKRCYQWTE
jgi:NADP-dependent 3-hydroxy acid dehydrogenase YdfG